MKKKGFTLIEMIVSMAMILIIFSVIASLMILAIKTNVRNEKDLDSDSISKAFVELVNFNKNEHYKENNDGEIYILSFEDTIELKEVFDTKFISGGTSLIKDENFDISTLVGLKKYAVKVKIIKDQSLNVFRFDIISWNLNKVSTSEISRTIYIAG